MTKLTSKRFIYYGVMLIILLAVGFGFHRATYTYGIGCLAMAGACEEPDGSMLEKTTITSWGLPLPYRVVDDREYRMPNGINRYERSTVQYPAIIIVDFAFWAAFAGAVQGSALWLKKRRAAVVKK